MPAPFALPAVQPNLNRSAAVYLLGKFCQEEKSAERENYQLAHDARDGLILLLRDLNQAIMHGRRHPRRHGGERFVLPRTARAT